MSRKTRGRRGATVSEGGGNPAGRPQTGQALAEYIRELSGPDGKVYVDKLHQVAIAKHRDTRSRLTAIGTLLERGYGKPPQTIDLFGHLASVAVDPSKLSDAELAAVLAGLRKAVGQDG